LLAVSYSLGMALVYTSLGLAAGLVGEGLAAFMQKPWVLCVFALLLTAMALSMFDVFELQLPASWQGHLSQWSGRFEGGQYLSVFVMGALSSLIVGPCVAGPLAGALLYISQTRDVFIGGFALFVMACGMSVPLLLTGLSAGSLLPRVGSWMLHIKSVFGFMLLGVALWMVNPLMNTQVRLMSWGGWLVLAAFFTPLFSMAQSTDGFSNRLGRAIGLLILLAGMAELVGGMMGHSDIWTPLKSPASSGANASAKAHVQFERIASMQALDEVLRNSDRPVVLDFYADWCASCLEMEQFTFTDPQVVAQMQGWRKLQIDVTNNTKEDRAFMRKFQLFGPPAMIFFKKNGTEFPDSRLMGYLPASAFNQHLDKLSKAN
jgi:thioredoxin:protein disulfide reductase